MAVLVAIILTVVFLSILIIGHEFGHFAAAKLLGVKIKEFGIGYPPRLASKTWRGTIYSLNAVPFGGFVNIAGLDTENGKKNEERGFKEQSFGRKSLILFSGILMNLLMAWLALSLVYSLGAPSSVYIASVSPGSAAESAGLKAGDKISEFSSGNDFIGYVDSRVGLETGFKIERGRQVIPLKILIPVEKSKSGRLGLGLIDTGVPRSGFGKGFLAGFSKTGEMLGSVVDSFVYLAKNRNFGDLSGPVGVWSAVRIADKLGAGYLLQLFSFVSLNLVFINILPLPALDGGRFIFLAARKLFRRSFNYRTEAAAHSIFFALLLFLMIIVTIKDIIRLF